MTLDEIKKWKRRECIQAALDGFKLGWDEALIVIDYDKQESTIVFIKI